jgi:tRNA threonylcarbamoyladenosine biosynthesis protein TsaB
LSPLNILALDTTTRAGSIAVARGGTLLAARAGDPSRTHGERLPGELMRAVGEAGLTVGDLDLLAVAVGPGSFTGLRVGVSAIQGLAVARGLRVVAVSTLDALARAAAGARRSEQLIATWMDGQRGEVFGALYDADGNTIASPVAGDPLAVLGGWNLPAEATVIFIGDGAVRYHDAIASRLGDRAHVIEPPLLAPTIARLAFEHPERAVTPHEIVPVYVRRPDAELARDRRQGRG